MGDHRLSNNQHFTPKKGKKYYQHFTQIKVLFFYLCPLMCCCYSFPFMISGWSAEPTWLQFSKTAGSISHTTHHKIYNHKLTQGQQTASAEFPRGILSWHDLPQKQVANHKTMLTCMLMYIQAALSGAEQLKELFISCWLITNISHTLPGLPLPIAERTNPLVPLNTFD